MKTIYKTPHTALLQYRSKRLSHFIASGVFDVFEKTILRPLPTLISLVLTLTTASIIIGIVMLYSYTIQNLNILSIVYIFGYIIGCIYEYVRLLLRQTQH